jgi:hypothetical protein
MTKQMGPWRAAFNWHMGVFVFGSLAATVLTVPCVIVLFLVYGQNPGDSKSAWIAVRVVQILQNFVIGFAGGALTLRYFRRRLPMTYGQMRGPMIITVGLIAALPVLLGVGIGLSRYGPTLQMILTASVIFGVFIACFLAGSFYFARKLDGRTNSTPEDVPR